MDNHFEIIQEPDGQLKLAPFQTALKEIYQSNILIEAQNNMKCDYSHRIFLAGVMQIRQHDTEFLTYAISLDDLSKLLNTDKANIQRNMIRIVNDLTEPLVFKKISPKRIQYMRIAPCKAYYDSQKGLIIKFDADLQPYLLGLKKQYTAIDGNDAMALSSNYASHLYQILLSRIEGFYEIGAEGEYVELAISDIRWSLGLADKYKNINDFRRRILDSCCNEISSVTMLRVSYIRLKKNSRVFDTVRFYINHISNKQHGWNGKEPDGYEFKILS